MEQDEQWHRRGDDNHRNGSEEVTTDPAITRRIVR